jgi:hypothetical protein
MYCRLSSALASKAGPKPTRTAGSNIICDLATAASAPRLTWTGAQLLLNSQPLSSGTQNLPVSLNSSALAVLPELPGSNATTGSCRAAQQLVPPPRPPPGLIVRTPPGGATRPPPRGVKCYTPPQAARGTKLPPGRSVAGVPAPATRPPPQMASAGTVARKPPPRRAPGGKSPPATKRPQPPPTPRARQAVLPPSSTQAQLPRAARVLGRVAPSRGPIGARQQQAQLRTPPGKRLRMVAPPPYEPLASLLSAVQLQLPYLQSNDSASSALAPLPGTAGAVGAAQGSSSALLLTAKGKLVFVSFATNTTLWSPNAGSAVPASVAKGPHKLELTADGELQLSSAGRVTWRAATRGKAQGPVRLTAVGQDLALQDLASNRTIWLAPMACSAFGATQVPAYGQCGANEPYTNTCCPTGFQCSRQSSSLWSCQPSGALNTCAGPKALAVDVPCGGINLCGKDAACSSECCEEGSFCQRTSSFTWSCALLSAFKGGLLNAG